MNTEVEGINKNGLSTLNSSIPRQPPTIQSKSLHNLRIPNFAMIFKAFGVVAIFAAVAAVHAQFFGDGQ